MYELFPNSWPLNLGAAYTCVRLVHVQIRYLRLVHINALLTLNVFDSFSSSSEMLSATGLDKNEAHM
jgi:hypothetical protein